jgi:DNA polymerase-3 subunit delta
MARSGPKKDSGGTRLSDFKKQGAADPKPIYVLRGTDPYLMDQGRRHVRQIVLGDADPGMALMELLGSEAVLADVLDALRTPPFLAPRRLVLVREAEAFLEQKVRGDETARDLLQKYLEQPAPSGVLCLETASWNENTKLAKRVAEVGLLVSCEMTDARLIPPWLQKEAKGRYGKTLTSAAIQMLLEYLGADFASLLAAVDMLALYAADAPTIDAPQVDALVARGHHERVWALCDALAERQVARALELLDAFWAEGMVAPQIVGLIRPTFRQLVRVKALSHRMGLDAAMSKAGVFYPAQDRVRRAMAAFSDEHLADAYQALVDADLEAKTTPNDRLAMETLIHRLCLAEAARGSAARSAAE